MLYKFRSKASGDVIMLQAHGDALLRLLGREPAARGIFEPGHMPGLLAALDAAVADAEATPATEPPGDADDGPRAVGLRQRLWPMIDLLRRSHAAGEPVVWGA
ncbi:MAG: DUF1840 domain-containing protein [Betaproteobacteria bacterium]